jgi:hypothetical protein
MEKYTYQTPHPPTHHKEPRREPYCEPCCQSKDSRSERGHDHGFVTNYPERKLNREIR